MYFPTGFHVRNPRFHTGFHGSKSRKPERRMFPSEETTCNLRVSRVETMGKHGGNLRFPSGFSVVEFLTRKIFSPVI